MIHKCEGRPLNRKTRAMCEYLLVCSASHAFGLTLKTPSSTMSNVPCACPLFNFSSHVALCTTVCLVAIGLDTNGSCKHHWKQLPPHEHRSVGVDGEMGRQELSELGPELARCLL